MPRSTAAQGDSLHLESSIRLGLPEESRNSTVWRGPREVGIRDAGHEAMGTRGRSARRDSGQGERRTEHRRPAPESAAHSTGRFAWLARHPVAVLLAAAFAVKLTVLAQLGGHPLLQPHGELDTTYYVELARRVAGGGPLAIPEPFFVSPLYVFFLATVFSVSGSSLVAARFVQILLGTTGVGLLYLTARHWFGARAAWIAAALAILTGLFTFYEVLILQAALDPFLVACSLYFISRTQVDDRLWPVAAAGASSGLLALNRPNALAYGLLAAALVGFASWRRQAPRAPSAAWVPLGRAGLFLACLLLVLAPNAIRNYAVSGELIPVSSHGGLNFYIGNNPEADGTYHPVPGITPSIAGQARDATRVAEAAEGRRLTTGEVSGYFYRRAWAWIAAHPAEALRLFAWKIAIVLNRTNVPLNYSYAYYSRDEPTLLCALVVGPWLLVPLGLVGLFLPSMRAGRSGFWVWGSFGPVYALSVAAFFVSSRYRMPLLLPLCATAAATVVWVFDRLRARRPALLVTPAIALAVTATLANWNYGLDEGRGGEQTRKAVWLVEQGAYEAARQYVASVSAGHSHPGVLRFQVGKALAAAGRLEEAIERFREALEIDRGQAAIHLALGEALLGAERADEAADHLATAFDARFRPEVSGRLLARALARAGRTADAVKLISTLPDEAAADEEAAFDLGTLALELGAPAQAERWLRMAVTRAPAHAEAYEKLGVALVLLRRADEAVAPIETACRLAPSSASAHLNLAVAYAQLGRVDDARAQGQEALRLDPNEHRAAEFLEALRQRSGR